MPSINTSGYSDNAIPTYTVDTFTSPALFTATDTLAGTPSVLGLPLTVSPTVGSIVAAPVPNGASTAIITVLNYSQSFYLEVSTNSTTGYDGAWVLASCSKLGIIGQAFDTLAYQITAAGVYTVACPGIAWVRARTTTTQSTCTVAWRFSAQVSNIVLGAPIPSGSGTLGTITGISSTVTTQGIPTNNKIGIVGGTTTYPLANPNITTSSAYAPGYCVGGLLTFTSAFSGTPGDSGTLQSIVIKTKQSTQTTFGTVFKLYLFGSSPTSSTFTDHAVPSFSSNDVQSLLGFWTLSNPDSGLGTGTIWRLDDINAGLLGSGTTLYGVLISLTSPTFIQTNELLLNLAIKAD